MLYSSSMNMDVVQKKQKPGGAAAALANGASPKTGMEADKPAVGTQYLLLQFKWLLVGIVCFVIAASIDYRRLKNLTPWLLGLSAFLLVLVFAPFIGHAAKGAHRWIGRPGGAAIFQPSELAKMALILFLAAYGERYQRQMDGFKKGLLIPGMVIAVVLGLIFIEPDRGCAILLAAVCGVMSIVAGARCFLAFYRRCFWRADWPFRFGMIRCAWAASWPGFIPSKTKRAWVIRLMKESSPWGRADGSAWGWATGGKNWVSCLNTTLILFSRSSAKNLDWWRHCPSCFSLSR